MSRTATYARASAETDISLSLNLDGQGVVSVSTGFGLADHFLTLFAYWARFDLTLACKGDLQVDAHHTVEDVGLCLGAALAEAAGDRKGMARVGFARVPMDEALAEVCVDFSGRAFLVWRGAELLPPIMGGEESDVWREFFKSLAAKAGMNVHIAFLYGQNGHHLLESACKGLGLAVRAAVLRTDTGLLSTKGRLD